MNIISLKKGVRVFSAACDVWYTKMLSERLFANRFILIDIRHPF